jgi:hypothetical protein
LEEAEDFGSRSCDGMFLIYIKWIQFRFFWI